MQRVAEQLFRIHVEREREPAHIHNGYISLSPLNPTDIRAVQTGGRRKLVLRPTLLLAQTPNVVPESGEKGPLE